MTRQQQQQNRFFIILLNFSIISLGFVIAKYEPTPDFIANINLTLENDIWQCDTLQCPPETFGCHILIENFNKYETLSTVVHTRTCFNKLNATIDGISWREPITVQKKIDIDIKSFNGAESIVTQGYGSGGQNAKGVVDVNKWKEFQAEAAEQKKNIDESMLKAEKN